MSSAILNIEDLEYQQWGHGDRFEARLGGIGARLGAQQLGYNLTVLPAGKCAFPFHNHRVNEEMFFIIEGTGELRLGEDRQPIRRGDVIACVAGGPESAHQIINTSSEELRFLAVSTRLSPEIAEYPDSGKYGVIAEFPGPDGKTESMRIIGREQASFEDYWDGE